LHFQASLSVAREAVLTKVYVFRKSRLLKFYGLRRSAELITLCNRHVAGTKLALKQVAAL
jgi:hypothetical protein